MQIIGHRGLMGMAPENSQASFELAIDKSVDWIEFDVQVSSDGHGVIIHDPDLNRLAGNTAVVETCSLQQLQDTHLLSGERLLSLNEALDIIGDRIPVMIELKSTRAAPVVANAIKQRKLNEQSTVVSSFLRQALREFHVEVPDIPTAKLRRWWPFVSKRLISQCGVKYVGLRHNWAKPFFVERLHSKNLKVYTYTIDDSEHLKLLDKMGMDLVVTNTR